MPNGTVLFWKTYTDSQRGFGFIACDDTPDKRETNVWFGPKSLGGLTVRSGDRVEFDVGNYRPGKGPSASHVRLCEVERNNVDKDETRKTGPTKNWNPYSSPRSRGKAEREYIETLPGADDY
ncbi:hypothetical protein [Bradyrhizobium sp. Ash2021]|uniref:cold-shock protein n=1 Tax=Bradyrhizobium sp. Ash2021 TaxID=2954771 RepID=UPI002814C676|nr:hypothetical protein [Bradyrhizobium sp. Ash2021]WMT75070.1 cold shock domain-containing protein [Bradyrhizobium sp. Ash2021]